MESKPKIYKPLKRTKKRPTKKAFFLDNNWIKVVFKWDMNDLAWIKSIPNHRWNSNDKYWTIPLTLNNCLDLKKQGFLLEQPLKDWGNQQWYLERKPKNIYIPDINDKLFPYQRDGVTFIETHKGRALIADEMGLGKTVQALAWLKLHPELYPIIVICPASLKYNWANEIKIWLKGIDYNIISGTKSYELVPSTIHIINFDLIPYWEIALKAINPKIIIIDEIHYIKNNSALRTKSTKKVCKAVPHLIGLSGTPIESKPVEIYNTVALINPLLFPNPWKFKHRYCGAKHNGFGWDFSGSSNIPELYQILTKNIMIRRKKKDVLLDLPDKIYSFVPLEIDNEKEYHNAELDLCEYLVDRAKKEFKENLIEFRSKYEIEDITIGKEDLKIIENTMSEKSTVLYQIEILKQLAAKGKMNSVIAWIENFLESGEKLVVFCEHIFVVDALINHFKKIAVNVDGRVSLKKRNERIKAFQNNNKIKLFIGNKAAEVGITLTAASNIAIMEFPWNPGNLSQRIDRCHRIGQKDTVNVFYLMALNTIDEKIAYKLDAKMKILNQVLDGKEIEQTELLEDLIHEFKK